MTLEQIFEVTLLIRHLKKHPEQATRLAIAHFEDYLVLLSQFQKLEIKVRELHSNNLDPKLVSLPDWKDARVTLEQEFTLTCLKLQLQQYPFISSFLAISYFQGFLTLSEKYTALQTDFFCLKAGAHEHSTT